MYLTTLRLPPYAIPGTLRGWPWLLLAGLLQPLAMEAYNVAYWYWPDPSFVRLVTLAGPMVVIAALRVAIDNQRASWALVVGFGLWIIPWQVVEIEQNWAYRTVFFGLQLIMAWLWWQAVQQKTAWLLELWAKRVGLIFALIGVAICVAVQFVFAETPFWGLMAAYNPASETVSAEVLATGIDASVWFMPLASALTILALTAFDSHRRCLGRRRRGPSQPDHG